MTQITITTQNSAGEFNQGITSSGKVSVVA